MRVLLLAQFLPPILGGEERHVWTLAKALTARGHDVTLLGLATGAEGGGDHETDGVRIVRTRSAASHLPMLYADYSRPHALPIPDPLVRRAIAHELAGGAFDVVHAHNWIVNSAVGPAARARVPLVMTLHDYSHICATKRLMERGSQVCPGPSLTRCLPCASSHYGVVNGVITLAANSWSARRRALGVSQFAAVGSSVAGAVSGSDGRMGRHGAALDVEVIPNFVPDEIVVVNTAPASSDAPLLYVGDLLPDKGIQTLLDAYRLMADPPALLLAGREPPEGTWQIPDGAKILGAQPHEEVLKYFRSARIVLVPSLCADACPTVVLEAMAAGRPVVAAASGGIVDLVVDGVTGLLVPPGDAEALAAAVTSLLIDPGRAHALGVAGRDRVLDFTAGAVARRVEAMYGRAITAANAEVTGGV